MCIRDSFWGALIEGQGDWLQANIPYLPWILLLMMFVSCYLLVSEIPMFALKFKHWGWKGNEVKYLFVLSCIPLLFFLRSSGIAVIIAWYIILSVATTKRTTE